MEIILRAMHSHCGRRFRHAPAGSRLSAENFLDFADKLRRGRRTAISHLLQRGEIILLSCRVLQKLPGNRRNAARRGDFLILNDLEGFFRVPFIHEDQRMADRYRAHHARVARGYVEQRNDEQANLFDRLRRSLTTTHIATCSRIAGREDIGRSVPVRTDCALWLSGRA